MSKSSIVCVLTTLATSWHACSAAADAAPMEAIGNNPGAAFDVIENLVVGVFSEEVDIDVARDILSASTITSGSSGIGESFLLKDAMLFSRLKGGGTGRNAAYAASRDIVFSTQRPLGFGESDFHQVRTLVFPANEFSSIEPVEATLIGSGFNWAAVLDATRDGTRAAGWVVYANTQIGPGAVDATHPRRAAYWDLSEESVSRSVLDLSTIEGSGNRFSSADRKSVV